MWKPKNITVICRHDEGALLAIENEEGGVQIVHAWGYDPETRTWGQGRYFGYVTGRYSEDDAKPLLRGIDYMREMGYIS